MKKDVSILIPTIRSKNLIKLYRSIELACQKYTFEVVFVGPYLIPDELLKKPNVKYIHSYANPTISFQMAAHLCNAEFIYNITDDGLVQPSVIDEAISFFRTTLLDKDMINMIYAEGFLDVNTLSPLGELTQKFPDSYWVADSHQDLKLPGIPGYYKTAPHFLMKYEYFAVLGGLDCRFEHVNMNLHDLAFRIQADGGRVVFSSNVAFYCSHVPNQTGDHLPIHDAHFLNDLPIFRSIYSQPNILNKRKILDFDDWKNYPSVWTRRFDTSNLPIHSYT